MPFLRPVLMARRWRQKSGLYASAMTAEESFPESRVSDYTFASPSCTTKFPSATAIVCLSSMYVLWRYQGAGEKKGKAFLASSAAKWE